MTTSVKVSDDAKSLLEELQAEIRLETGRNVSQQELLDRMIRRSFETKAELIDSFGESKVPLSEAEIEEYLSYTFSSDEPIDEDDIDRILYDEEQSV